MSVHRLLKLLLDGVKPAEIVISGHCRACPPIFLLTVKALNLSLDLRVTARVVTPIQSHGSRPGVSFRDNLVNIHAW